MTTAKLWTVMCCSHIEFIKISQKINFDQCATSSRGVEVMQKNGVQDRKMKAMIYEKSAMNAFDGVS